MSHITSQLKWLQDQHLLRQMRRIDSASDAEILLENKPVLLFSSNNYLGLANDDTIKQRAIEAIQLFGTGSGGSRLTTGNLCLHEQLERMIAEWKGTESALLFSSGYLANTGTISSLMGKGDFILSDELNHASLIDGCRLSRAKTAVYRHVNMDDLRSKLKQLPAGSKKLIVTDGVFSMDGNLAPLPDIVELAEAYQAWIMVDDAHGAGVLGKNGRGTAEWFNLEQRIHLHIGTMSKAIAAEGGYVAASKEIVTYLANSARPFIFQTSLSPAVIAAGMAAIEKIQQEPERRQHVLKLSAAFRRQLREAGFAIVSGETPIIALIVGEADAALRFSQELEKEGVYAPAIRPPTVPAGTSRIRFTLMASHTNEQVDRAAKIIIQTGKKLPFI
ncbi:8-amino-7-oxononanoate synthase [Bacillus xiapuensis]|uniref:8-amino-7-oxononanoate synthase n=1 Tax=Bacillus xiapuensis TaxID=2014075 RepID=UPI000C24D117|nr:8-amino-7-oxononanoate synthase [Bacillus xiapuensis]